MKHKNKLKIRKAHRVLGVAMGVQFLFWTLSGLYFSWTDLDQIHGDDFKKLDISHPSFSGLISPDSLQIGLIESLELREIEAQPYYWINDEVLIHAKSGEVRDGVTEREAIAVAARYMREELTIKQVDMISEAGPHHEYREKKLPAYAISYDHPHQITAYVSIVDGKFQTVRHRNWRWFDFLWMTHTMDYQTRDNFNTFLLRVFSLFGLVTVLSGFALFFTSVRWSS